MRVYRTFNAAAERSRGDAERRAARRAVTAARHVRRRARDERGGGVEAAAATARPLASAAHRLPRPRRGRGGDVRQARRATRSPTSSCASTSRRASSRRCCAAARSPRPPDITARICGICPVAYQMSAVRAMEDACGVSIDEGPLRDLRRLLYCGEWIESHSLHVYMLHAPDFLGYAGAVEMARDHREIVEQGLQMKKAGNALMARRRRPRGPPDQRARRRLLPRAHPRASCARCVDPLERARETRSRPCAGPPSCRSPTSSASPSCSRSATPPATRSTAAGSSPTAASTSPRRVRRAHRRGARRALQRAARPHPRARHLPDRPARALRARLDSAAARRRARPRREAGLGRSCRNPFQSIVVRAVELVQACDEALAIIDRYEQPDAPAVEVAAAPRRSATARPRRPAGCSTTATRSTRTARSSTPRSCRRPRRTSSRSRRTCAPSSRLSLDLPDEQLALRCEQAIRNHDPCISCATHFLTLTVDRGVTPGRRCSSSGSATRCAATTRPGWRWHAALRAAAPHARRNRVPRARGRAARR